MKRQKLDKNVNKKENKSQEKHPGGPLKRHGASADSWNESLGSSLDTIPSGYLPTHRIVLRRYRYLRTNDANSPINDIIDVIVDEIFYIWN